MRRLLVLAVVVMLSILTRTAWSAEESALVKLHGGNILQAVNKAASDGGFKDFAQDANLNIINDVATISIKMKSAQELRSSSGEDLSSQTAVAITLNKETGKVKTILFGVEWQKNEASALHAFLSAGFVTKIMGKIARQNIAEDTLQKLHKALLGEKTGDFLDGKERAARIDSTLCSSQFVSGVGLLLSMSVDTRK